MTKKEFEDFEKRLNQKLIKVVNDWLKDLKNSIDNKTPEDTKTLLWNNDISEATQIWNTIIWSIFNTTKYWIFVEYWVWWNKYKYNKPKWNIFYKWVWARMFTRWFDEEKPKILNNINKAKND